MTDKPAKRRPKAPRHITADLVRAALDCIPPMVDRETWVRLAMAIKAELGAEGFDLWDRWSQQAEGYSATDARDTWRSIKAGGKVTVGTLFGIAKTHGFRFPEREGPAVQTPATAEVERQAKERQRQREAEEARYRERADAAARVAEQMWADASEAGASPYLTRKGVQPHGVRFMPDGTLLVPMRNAAGELQNLQRIAPQKPANDKPEKLFLPGGRKSGLWHLIGDIEGAEVLLIAEGLATGSSLHEATGRPVAIAFDAGNLAHVVRELRTLHPALPLLVCGDDDHETEARTGKNPGREKARAAARAGVTDAGRAQAVFPAFAPGDASGRSDMNDLAALAGPAAVRDIVEPACAALLAGELQSIESKPRRARKGAPGAADDSAGRDDQAGSAGADDDSQVGPSGSARRDPFTVDERGVWFTPASDESGAPRWVCGPLRVLSLARDVHDTHAALMLEFESAFGKRRRWLMPLAMLSGDGAAYRGELLSQGFMCPTDQNRRKWLTDYLQSRRPDVLVRHVSRVGWCGRAYVLPTETLTADKTAEPVVFYSEAGIEANFSQRGSLEAWQSTLARLCVGNSRLAFAVACAFAGPLLAWAPGTSGGGVHYVGATSTGKTTGLLIGASVWGKGSENDPESYMQKWRATSSGLEYQAEQHNACTMFLDELGQTDAADAGPIAYMLADGVGKMRGKASGGLRHKPTWGLLFMSSGELTLEQHMETAGKTMQGGQEVRLIPIPAEVSPGSTFETVHEFSAGHEMSVHVKHHAAKCYGWAGHEWLRYLVHNTEGLAARVRQGMEAFEAELPLAGAGGQVKRGARRFALIAAAGEMATAAGLTGWPAGEASRAARVCFDAWIRTRDGGVGASERAKAVRNVRYWIEKNGDANLTLWHRIADARKANTPMRCGFRRLVDDDGLPIKFDAAQDYSDEHTQPERTSAAEARSEYLITVEAFRRDLCKGGNWEFVANVLKDLGVLVHEGGRLTKKHRVPSIGKQAFYHLKPEIMELEL